MEEEKSLFENKTLYTKELYLEFSKFHLRKRSLITAIPLYICMAIMTLSSILLIVLNLDISAGIAFLILSLAVILIYIFLPNISVSKVLKFDKTFENTENKYEFYEDYLFVENKYGSTKVDYNDLYKVYETKNNIYIYINSTQAFLVSKSGFDSKLDEVKEFLKNKFKERYIEK